MPPKQKKPVQRRTLSQNRAIHLLLTWYASELNRRNLPPEKVLREGIEIVWTPRLVASMAKVLAKFMNDSGIAPLFVFKRSDEEGWTPDLVKELLWRTVQKKIIGVKSTTELRKIGDIEKVHDVIDKHLSERFGVHFDFPSLEAFLAKN